MRRAPRHGLHSLVGVAFDSITPLAAAITYFTTNLSGTPAIGQTLWIGRATLSGQGMLRTDHQIFNVTIIIGASVSVVGYWDTVAAPRLIARKRMSAMRWQMEADELQQCRHELRSS